MESNRELIKDKFKYLDMSLKDHFETQIMWHFNLNALPVETPTFEKKPNDIIYSVVISLLN